MSRIEILGLYKSLLRTASVVFKGDVSTLTAAASEIQTQFRQPRDPSSIQDAYQGGVEAEIVLRKGVLQIEETEKADTYKANLRPEFALEDNVAFKTDISPEEYKKSILAAKKSKKKKKNT
eukprot:TRINITY_DN2671_c1_g2_i1.p1 TRINITY_DN2671_c1_g2~~TRINITY_DN2671_c1_g2_i1.p1  ORF type:complete len:121 (+),score=28.09 TRINITY_DN2671_c1_g2_i1:148-510(+)